MVILILYTWVPVVVLVKAEAVEAVEAVRQHHLAS